MADTCFIVTPTTSVYTTGKFEEVVRKLNAGEPLRCWWFGSEGNRFEELFAFTEYSFVRTESDVPND